MTIPRIELAALLTLTILASGLPAEAASPAEIAAQKQQALDAILNVDSAYDVAAQRWVCAMGKEPDNVRTSRAQGAYFFPDAADSCPTALVRTAHDRHLPDLYVRLLAELGGSAKADQLARAISAAVLGGDGKVAIGNGKVAVVTPALAFDAGFTVAYQEGGNKPPSANAAQLKTLAESCLAQHGEVGSCFSAGFMYGAQALKGQSAAGR